MNIRRANKRAHEDTDTLERQRQLPSSPMQLQLILCRRLHRQVGRLLALKDAINLIGRWPVSAANIIRRGAQTTPVGRTEGSVDGGQPKTVRQRNNHVAPLFQPFSVLCTAGKMTAQ
jgi:hypothetical protein